MHKLLDALRQAYPDFSFVEGDQASWSWAAKQITYGPLQEDVAMWSLLHELGHAKLDHRTYKSDIDLLKKEVAAWEVAQKIGKDYSINIKDDYLQNCLDTYRDWLHKRSTCPRCENHGLQITQSRYNCLNCGATWKVSLERFCRPYRLTVATRA